MISGYQRLAAFSRMETPRPIVKCVYMRSPGRRPNAPPPRAVEVRAETTVRPPIVGRGTGFEGESGDDIAVLGPAGLNDVRPAGRLHRESCRFLSDRFCQARSSWRMSRPLLSGNAKNPITAHTEATTMGYQRPWKMSPVAATIAKATVGRNPPNQPLPMW